MTKRSARPGRPQGTEPPSFDFDGSRLTGLAAGDSGMFASEQFEGTAYAGIALDEWQIGVGTTIDGCRFTKLELDSWTLRGARIVESVFDGVDVPVVTAARAGLRDVEIRDSRFGSVEAYDGAWRGIRFTRCRLGFVNLRATDLLDVAFQDCTIDEIDLLDATARRVAFGGCRIGALNVGGASLTDVDLRGADLREVVGLAGLRGATISPEQLQLMAPALAELAGLRVED
ncbi:pentapeptide repeat-containing protein [Microbacterium sp. CPCC 204701]|uniref:pentapeptide repeat-containing protein n=1 Tax=Microbacterium sp. CPCC 204701 TaxID=2493084 RepID=UPI000FDA9170|nr:pentapeptide repeat-containing protein [Microbacterium sp. CPCC 204701]